MDAKAEKIALFRYGLIATLVLEPLPRGELTRRAEEIAARHYEIPASQRTSVSVDTLLDWALRYRNGGFEALAPQPRQDRGQSRTITPQLADLIERLKRENPHRTGTTLLRELALSSGQNEPAISASTLYRFLKQRGLTERQLLAPPAHKKFEAELANQIWQSDMLYGPYVQRPGGGKMQALLHAILDDASRLIPHAQFYASEGLDVCLDCLRQAVAARGVAVRLYMDNAKIYRSPQLARIAASIGMLIVHTPPYQPEGRGKIERFFQLDARTVPEQPGSQTDAVAGRAERAPVGLARPLPPHRAQQPRDHALAPLATRHRAHPPTASGHRLPPSLLPPPGSRGAPRLHVSTAQPFLRGAAASGRRNHRSAFRSSRSRHRRDLFPGQAGRRQRGSSIRSSMPSCPRPSHPKRNPNPPASTSSICSLRKRTRRKPPW